MWWAAATARVLAERLCLRQSTLTSAQAWDGGIMHCRSAALKLPMKLHGGPRNNSSLRKDEWG